MGGRFLDCGCYLPPDGGRTLCPTCSAGIEKVEGENARSPEDGLPRRRSGDKIARIRKAGETVKGQTDGIKLVLDAIEGVRAVDRDSVVRWICHHWQTVPAYGEQQIPKKENDNAPKQENEPQVRVK